MKPKTLSTILGTTLPQAATTLPQAATPTELRPVLTTCPRPLNALFSEILAHGLSNVMVTTPDATRPPRAIALPSHILCQNLDRAPGGRSVPRDLVLAPVAVPVRWTVSDPMQLPLQAATTSPQAATPIELCLVLTICPRPLRALFSEVLAHGLSNVMVPVPEAT
ncbi:hypothetical protein TorRG33x02_315230 [Trema orientale]|uniref:Uncharacterized protein n=1 Tax=Trema orientale TaxID=63057 RepID=A0A2P5BN25_TREOI|nr:hypothetical protein TorRG33x02_315230 [Trema orientale]